MILEEHISEWFPKASKIAGMSNYNLKPRNLFSLGEIIEIMQK